MKNYRCVEVSASAAASGLSRYHENILMDVLESLGFGRADVVRVQLKSAVKYSIFLKNVPQARSVAGVLRNTFDNSFLQVQVHALKREDWFDKWMHDFKIFNLGRRFTIVPYWLRKNFPKKPNGRRRQVIIINPLNAFGSGLHATTQMMLGALEGFEGRLKDVLDLGSGSGILAIAAHKLGAHDVCGVERLRQAAGSARFNVKANRCSNVRIINRSIGKIKLRKKYDLVMVNILSKIIVEHKDIINRLIKPGGYLIVSGVDRAQDAVFRKNFAAKGLRCQRRIKSAEWMGYVYKKRL